MAAETSGESYLSDLYSDAFNWLNVVGEYDHRLLKPRTRYNNTTSRVLQHIGGQVREGDYETVYLLATLEREAQQHASQTDYISDHEVQVDTRFIQFQMLSKLLGGFADSAYVVLLAEE